MIGLRSTRTVFLCCESAKSSTACCFAGALTWLPGWVREKSSKMIRRENFHSLKRFWAFHSQIFQAGKIFYSQFNFYMLVTSDIITRGFVRFKEFIRVIKSFHVSLHEYDIQGMESEKNLEIFIFLFFKIWISDFSNIL